MREILRYLALYVVRRLLPLLASQRPGSARVKDIPSGPKSLVTTATGVMVAESVDQPVPHRREVRNQQLLG